MSLLPESKNTREFTDMQKAFLDALFGECLGNVKASMKAAGYGATIQPHQVIGPLKDEIIERAEYVLASNAPKAAFAIVGLVDDPEAMGAKTKLTSAMTILDRVGLAKRDRLEISTKDNKGIFILPAKRED